MNDANVRIYFNFIRTTYVIHISKKIGISRKEKQSST